MTQDRITFKCKKCGSASFTSPADPKPDDVVTCNGCGDTGSYADVQAAAIQLGKQEIGRLLGDAMKGWTRKK